MERIEQLVRSLGGVISVRAVPDGEGEVDTLHVLAADSVARDELVREIESALLTYFDLALEPDQTSVVISHDPDLLADEEASEPGGSGNGAGTSAPAPDDRWPEPASGPGGSPEASRRRFEVRSPKPGDRRRPGGDRFPEPGAPPDPFENTSRSDEHHPAAAGAPAPRRASRPRSGERSPSEPDPASPSLRLVRFTAEGDEGPGVEVRVTVEVDGERYDGVAHADRLDGLEPRHFAEAAAHAAEIALRSSAATGDDRTSVRVQAVERLELFDRPYVAVSIEARGRSARREVTGFHPDVDGPSRAAALAVLDGVRRTRNGS